MTRTVVFLHAGTAGGWMWEPQVEALSDRPTFAPDLPGYLSRRGEPWTSFDSVTDRLAGMIAAEADGPVDVVGLSMGAIVSLHLAQRHPHLVASAFVTGTSVLPYTAAMRASNAVSLALWNRRFFWAGIAGSMGFDREATREFVTHSPPFTRESAREQLHEVHRGGLTPLEQITAPVLAIVGEREIGYFHRSLHVIGSTLPGVQTGLAPGMHHAWSAENPDLFNRMLRTWLDERQGHPELLPLP